MPAVHDKPTIVSMAVIASATATLLHEGLGHGVLAWLHGDIVTELTSNHLSDLKPDRWVDAGGTVVNLAVGFAALFASKSTKGANTRYFLWLLAALNLLPGAGYFMFSGIGGFGDWYEVIKGLPYEVLLRILMTLFGAALYVWVVRLLAVALRPFVTARGDYNTVGRLPYYAAGLFSCAAGILDPTGLKLFFFSTIPAAFGGSSGLLWADSIMPRTPLGEPAPVTLSVHRQPLWWVAAAILGAAYIWFLGRGIEFAH
jgi:hypothetical protein